VDQQQKVLTQIYSLLQLNLVYFRLTRVLLMSALMDMCEPPAGTPTDEFHSFKKVRQEEMSTNHFKLI